MIRVGDEILCYVLEFVFLCCEVGIVDDGRYEESVVYGFVNSFLYYGCWCYCCWLWVLVKVYLVWRREEIDVVFKKEGLEFRGKGE